MTIAKRNYVVPLRRKYANTQRPQRAKKAMSVLKEFLAKHMKSDEVRVGSALNEFIWQNGIKNPPGKVSIVAEKNEEGIVYADLEGNKLPSELSEETPKQEEKKEEPKEKPEEKESTKEEAKDEPENKKESKKETDSKDAKKESKSETDSEKKESKPKKKADKKSEK